MVRRPIHPARDRRRSAPPATRRSPRQLLRRPCDDRGPQQRRGRTQDRPRNPRPHPCSARPRRGTQTSRHQRCPPHPPTATPGASSAARTWTAGELSRFLAAAREQRLYPALHLAAHTGMRRGEIIGLKWSDLNVAHARLSISRTLQNVGGRPVEFGVKTRTTHRTVELDQTTLQQLLRWRRRLERDRLPAGADDWVSTTPAADSSTPESVSQLFERIVRRSNLPRVRFHDLRHTHASLLIADGAPIKVVSERLGHAHPSFTMHTYQHLLPGMSSAAAERFATLIADSGR